MLSRLSARIVLRPISLSSSVYKKKYCTEAVTPKIDSLVNGEKSGNDTSFATLLRNSTFVQMGNPIGKVSSFSHVNNHENFFSDYIYSKIGAK